MEVPSDRCGFVLQPEQIGWDPDRSDGFEWAATVQLSACARKPWKNGRCIWHADTDDKPVDEIKDERADSPECLDGAILTDIEIEESISFSDCSLIGSDFQSSELDRITFSGADLRGADFTDAYIVGSEFTNSELIGADLQGTDIRYAEFNHSNLEWAVLREADAANAKFRNSYCRNTNITGGSFERASFERASLETVNFEDAHLRHTDFRGAYIHDTTFTNCFLRYAKFSYHLQKSKFIDSDLSFAEFHSIDMKYSTFEKSRMVNSELRECDLYRAEFIDLYLGDSEVQESNLEQSKLIRTDLSGTNISESKLYQIMFENVRFNNDTTFIDSCPYTNKGNERPSATDFEKSTWVYRRLSDLHSNNAMSRRSREFHIKKEETRRDKYLLETKQTLTQREYAESLRHGIQYAISSLNRQLTNHGESLLQVGKSSALTIILCAAVYPFVGGIRSSSQQESYVLSLSRVGNIVASGDLSSIADSLLNVFGQSIYFSAITFTTIGYGDLYPTGIGSKLLVAFESLSGALLLALAIYVLGRQVSR